jgi:hypothetical protein
MWLVPALLSSISQNSRIFLILSDLPPAALLAAGTLVMVL